MIKQDDMGNMIDKTLKQINTNIVPQNNVPMVPEHLQAQNMMRPVVSPPTLPGLETPPQASMPLPNANFNPYQGGMGNQMGTYPLAQENDSIVNPFYTGSPKDSEFKAVNTGTNTLVEGANISDSTDGINVVSTKGSGALTEGIPNVRTKTGIKEHHPNIQRSTNTAWYDKP